MGDRLCSYLLMISVISLFLLISVNMPLLHTYFSADYSQGGLIRVKGLKDEKKLAHNVPINTSASTITGRFLGLRGNSGRLGNQIWILVSGWAIAESLNRKHYINIKQDEDGIRSRINQVTTVFPKFSETFEYLKPLEEKYLPHAFVDGKPDCCVYEDPMRLSHFTDSHIVLDMQYAQNARYFIRYEDKVRSFFTCSTDMKRHVFEAMERLSIAEDSVACAHVRKGDFQRLHWDSDSSTIIQMISMVIKKGSRLLLFGDDRRFLNSVIKKLIEGDIINSNSTISQLPPAADLCLVQHVCSSFILTSQASSFGFWLAFLSKNQTQVYFPDEIIMTGKPHFDEEFPLPWIPVKLKS